MNLQSGTALLFLGAVHGLNPGMGWLFAVALGLQERRRGALWGALPPLALGHAAAILAALVAAALLGRAFPLTVVEWVVGGMLIVLGGFRLLRHRHPRGGMRVGPRDLALWSLAMATAHGAGLMVLPVVLAVPQSAHAAHTGSLAMAGVMGAGGAGAWWATALHTVGYLAATMLAAVVVYERFGVGVVRRVWVNVDLIWGPALIITGIFTIVA
ncbi:MAG TPA: hypothetical protein VH700_17145 [Gemmatimonadales bacterium]